MGRVAAMPVAFTFRHKTFDMEMRTSDGKNPEKDWVRIIGTPQVLLCFLVFVVIPGYSLWSHRGDISAYGRHHANQLAQNPESGIRKMMRYFDKGAIETFDLSTKYFDDQKPLVFKSASSFQLKSSFAQLAETVDGTETYNDLIRKRMDAMLTGNVKDFLVTTDACLMNSFLTNNKLPGPKQVDGHVWRDENAFISALKSGDAVASVQRWPVMLRACHISSSVKLLESKEHMFQLLKSGALATWVKETWAATPSGFGPAGIVKLQTCWQNKPRGVSCLKSPAVPQLQPSDK